MTRLKILEITDLCTACGSCVNICGSSSLQLRADTEGFLMPVVNMDTCSDCGLCEKACPVFVDKEKVDLAGIEGYAGWSRDKQLVAKSSSGGFFSVLSTSVLDDSGVVFGARYDYKKKRLEQCHTDDFDLSAFRQSKYFESNTLEAFSAVRKFLKQNRWVLYCGTPCQVLGLKRFLEVLHIDTGHLILVDFICHGVLSNDHFSQYIRTIEEKLKSELVSIDFCSKKSGWSGNMMSVKYVAANGKLQRSRAFLEDPFYMAFLDGLLLRRSCYACEAIHYHGSDLTIGDFVGRKGVVDDDDTGISLMIANSEKGKAIVEELRKDSNVYLKNLDKSQYEYAYKRNKAEYSLELRAQMLRAVQQNGFASALDQRYARRIRQYRVKQAIKKLIRYKS
ncbi:MAG: Coenzyme F420 hydrogenase/dehydrogenase, beta subunit C-terminal domain [Bacteroidota bacterium]|nr:Coenzyme F420 hydrogenase/dehydrogenase, beta subunit C-terminal domain [Bacteroidota bacterium]